MSKRKLSKTVILSSALMSLLTQGGHRAIAGMTSGACDTKLINISLTSGSLKFASIFPCPATSGDVTLDAKNNGISTAGCITGTFGAGLAPVVKITPGQANKSHKIVVGVASPTDTVTNTGSKVTMTVTAFDFNSKNGGSTIQIDGTNTRTIPIGGVLNVKANQAEGLYTGTFTVVGDCL